jgi:hypothetical protein
MTLITPASTLTKLETLKSYWPHKLVIVIVSELARDTVATTAANRTASSPTVLVTDGQSKVLRGFVKSIRIAKDLVAGLEFRAVPTRR